jgi:hypothetical protein
MTTLHPDIRYSQIRYKRSLLYVKEHELTAFQCILCFTGIPIASLQVAMLLTFPVAMLLTSWVSMLLTFQVVSKGNDQVSMSSKYETREDVGECVSSQPLKGPNKFV